MPQRHTHPETPAPQIARVYLRVSTEAQDLRRQDAIVAEAKAAGYYVAAVYREKASGARADRPELLRMIADLQPGEVVTCRLKPAMATFLLKRRIGPSWRAIGAIPSIGATMRPSLPSAWFFRCRQALTPIRFSRQCGKSLAVKSHTNGITSWRCTPIRRGPMCI